MYDIMASKLTRTKVPGNVPHVLVHLSLVLRLPHSGMRICIHGETLVSFHMWVLHDWNRTRVFRTERQRFVSCSTNYSFNTQCVRYSPSPDSYIDTCSKLPTTFTLFSVFGYTHTQLRSLYPSLPLALLTWEKYKALPACTTSMFTFQSREAWEQG